MDLPTDRLSDKLQGHARVEQVPVGQNFAMTFSITTLSMMTFSLTIRRRDTQHNDIQFLSRASSCWMSLWLMSFCRVSLCRMSWRLPKCLSVKCFWRKDGEPNDLEHWRLNCNLWLLLTSHYSEKNHNTSFSSYLTNEPNKLEGLSLVSISNLV